MKKNEKNFLQDRTEMGDTLYIFETDAPIEHLKKLEKISCDAYINGNRYDDIPVWANELEKKGYIFKCIDEFQNIGVYSSSYDLRDKYSDIKEEYLI